MQTYKAIIYVPSHKPNYICPRGKIIKGYKLVGMDMNYESQPCLFSWPHHHTNLPATVPRIKA